MPRRYYFRTEASDAAGFTSGVSKSFAMDQAINNQPVGAFNPVVFYGGELTPRLLSTERGQFDTGTSLSVNPYTVYGDENLRGFLTHFITKPEKAQHLRAGFTRIALKGVHASGLSIVQLQASIYIVTSTGSVVSFLWDKDKALTPALVSDPTTAGVVLMMNIPTKPGDIPELGRVVVELWTRHTPDYYIDDAVGAEIFLEGSDESFGPTVGGAGEYDTDSVASYVEFPQSLELAAEQPVFAVRIEPLQGMKHSRIWNTDVIERDESSEQRARLRKKPNNIVEFIGVGHGTDEMQLMDALIEKLSDRSVWLPWWRDEQILPSTLALAATSLAVATTSYAFIAGDRAIIWQDPFTWEVVTIDTVNDGDLVIADGLTREWIAGSASIMPLKDAVMLGAVKEDRQTADFATAELAFVLTSLQSSGETIGSVLGTEPEGDIGDCLHPNTTTSAATSGLSPTKWKGDDFSAWGLEDYEAFIDDTVDNPNYQDGVGGHPYFKRRVPAQHLASNLPAYFWEFFDDTTLSFPYTPGGGQVNRNRISQLAINGGHRTVKAVKTADDIDTLFNGFEIWAADLGETDRFINMWSRLRFQYSANFPMGDAADFAAAVGGVYLFSSNDNFYNSDVTVATGTLSNPSSKLTISHKTKNVVGFGTTTHETVLGEVADLVTTGTPQELVVFAGIAGGVYRVAVWMGPAFSTLTKLYDASYPCGNFRLGRHTYFMRSKNTYHVPVDEDVICYECISWEVEDGSVTPDPYGVDH